MAKLTICNITQNAAGQLEGLLANVEDLAWEIVVVDGGSDDHTAELVQSHPKVRYFQRDFDGNFSSQYNYAFDRAQGDWIMYLDTDERVGHRLSRRLPKLLAHRRYQYYRLRIHWLASYEPLRYYRLPAFSRHYVRLFRNLPHFRYDETQKIHSSVPYEEHGPGKVVSWTYLYHLCYLFLSPEERREKLEFYHRLEEGNRGLDYVYRQDELDGATRGTWDRLELPPCDLALLEKG